MDKIEKALAKLMPQERKIFRDLLIDVKTGRFENLDIKKLKGRADIFRVRKGRMRLIFRKTENSIFILTLERRSDNTYRF